MRAQWVLLLCLEYATHFASASSFNLRFRHGRGTVAERRESEKSKQLPEMSMKNAPPNPGLAVDTPESFQNVQNYQIALPTPAPAAFNGVFCRGGACQYRVAPPPPTLPPPMTPPPLPIGGNMLSGREFCRGLSCIGGMGWPGDPALAAFNLNCIHLFNDVGGGLSGTDTDRTVAQVHDSFSNVCKKRVGILEVGACPTYANTFLAAVSSKVNNPTVGGAVEVCTDTYLWNLMFKQAEIDLKVTAAALPKGNSLLAADLNRFGSGGVGPSSARGLRWREYAWNHGIKPLPPAEPRQLASDGSIAGLFLQTNEEAKKPQPPPEPKPLLPGADNDEDTPRGLPKYTQNPPCDTKAKHAVPQTATKYQIAPGSPDGTVPPVEVAGDLFTYCSNQFSEIMMGFAQTAPETIKLTKGWCAWQSSVSSWVGKKEEFGHPDWTHRTCEGMQNLLAFALRDQLGDHKSGLSSQQVCKKIFLAIGAVHRTDGIIKEAWGTSLRGAPSSGIPAADDSEMKKLLQEAQAYANKIFSKLRGQKSAYEDLNNKKMDMASFDAGAMKLPEPAAAPDLPNAADVDPTALLALSVERVRQNRVGGIAVVDHLKSWGTGI